MENEIWKDVKGFEGIYQVSNMGRVKRLANEKGNGRGNHAREENIFKQFPVKYYIKVDLYKNNKRHHFTIHRLVATAFIPNPDNLPCINHKDENKLNNCVENLEWCTQAYNVNYGTRVQRTSKPVVQKTKSGEVVKEYQSASQAQRETGIFGSNIGRNIKGKCKTAGGYIWERL